MYYFDMSNLSTSFFLTYWILLYCTANSNTAILKPILLSCQAPIEGTVSSLLYRNDPKTFDIISDFSMYSYWKCHRNYRLLPIIPDHDASESDRGGSTDPTYSTVA
jgi:hypothetical protein